MAGTLPRAEADGALLDVSSAWDEEGAVLSAATQALPEDVKVAAVRGVGLVSLVGGGVLCTYVLAYGLTAHSGSLPAPRLQLLSWAIALDLAMFALSRARRAQPDMVLRVGFVHFVVVAFLLGALRHSHPGAASVAALGWSPVGVWILLLGALVPLRPGTVLGWSLVAAAMDVLALVLTTDPTVRVSMSDGLVLAVSPFLAALMAYVFSTVIYGLTERVARARQFGSYRLVERLGAGGTAEVWRADHRMLARPAALKLVRPTVLSMYGQVEAARLVRLFEREVQATAGLRSPHTIQVYDFGIARDGTFYYVMELLDGFDLQTLVERFGPQPAARVIQVLRQACHSLHEAHTQGLVHRDVKPGNIYLCRYGMDLDFVKLLDFGLVLDRRPTAEELDERRGQVGTPAVMAPEQMRFDAPVDQRTDIYALGCVAYWLVAGVRVFEAETRHDMLVMHAHQRPVPPSRRSRVSVPADLESLVMACLEKNPNKRPASAQELSLRLAELDPIEEGSPAAWASPQMEAWWAGL